MPCLLKHTPCPACGHRHHFCFVTGEMVQGREYDYVCPETAKKASLRATSWERVPVAPQGAIELSATAYGLEDIAERPESPSPSSTRLQEVLPDVNQLAGKVGGLEQLSEIVETLKETNKE
jgi:hypothetical protein